MLTCHSWRDITLNQYEEEYTMPNTYNSGTFIFIKVDEDDDGNGYYDIIHSSGRKWDYRHKFSSISEMNEYDREHS